MSYADTTIAATAPAEPDLDAFRVPLDLNHALAVYQRGSIMVWMTWLRTIDRWDPCIALTKANLYDTSGQRTVPCVIPLSRAYAWAGAIAAGGNLKNMNPALRQDLRDVMTTAADFAWTLGLNGILPRDVFKVIAIVDDHLSELISMPPRPVGLGAKTVADMVVTDAVSGKVWETEVKDVL